MAWTLTAQGSSANSNYSEWLVDTEEDVTTNLPDFQKEFGFTPAPGSVAYLCENTAGGAALGKLWMRSKDGHWNSF